MRPHPSRQDTPPAQNSLRGSFRRRRPDQPTSEARSARPRPTALRSGRIMTSRTSRGFEESALCDFAQVPDGGRRRSTPESRRRPRRPWLPRWAQKRPSTKVARRLYPNASPCLAGAEDVIAGRAAGCRFRRPGYAPHHSRSPARRSPSSRCSRSCGWAWGKIPSLEAVIPGRTRVSSSKIGRASSRRPIWAQLAA
jgi:hypothetical protein